MQRLIGQPSDAPAPKPQQGAASTQADRLQLIEAMRGAAAVWVVLHHAGLSVTAFLAPIGNLNLVSNGFLGVDFFFVLSGFIIAYSSDKLLRAGGTIRAYMCSRLIRVYVPYLPVGIGLLVLYWQLPGLSASDRSVSTLTSLTLLPTNNPPALSVAWTLVHELIFYSIYSLKFVSERFLILVLALWAIVIVAATARGIEIPLFASYFLSPLNLCFLLGVATFHARALPLWPPIANYLGVGALISVIVVASSAMPNRVIVALSFSALVLAASTIQRQRAPVWAIGQVLGAASYSIYLVHNPILSLMSRIVSAIGLKMDPVFAVVTFALAGVVAGVIYWLLLERPLLRIVRAAILAPSSTVHDPRLARH